MRSEVELQRHLLDAAENLLGAALAVGDGANPVVERLETLQDAVTEGLLRVAVVGEFSNGKSTLINSLLGAAVLPMGLAAATRAPALIRHGESLRVWLVYNDGVRLSTTPAMMQALDPDQVARLSRVEVETPVLAPGVLLIDTPGLGESQGTSNAAIHEMVIRADAAVCVLNCDRLLSLSEQKYISEELVPSGGPKMAFVLNRIDGKTPEEIESLVDRARHILGEFIPDAALLPFSALQALQAAIAGDTEKAKIADPAGLRSKILEEWPAAGQEIRTASAARQLTLTGAAIEKELARLEAGAAESQRQVLETGERLQRHYSQLQDRIEIAARKMESGLDSIESQFVVALKECALKLRSEVPREVMDVSVEDARRYLALYIQDTLRRAVRENDDAIRQAIRHIAQALPSVAEAALAPSLDLFHLEVEPPALPLHPQRDRAPLSQGASFLMAGSSVLLLNRFPIGLLLLSTSLLSREIGRQLEAADRRVALATGAQMLVTASMEIMEQGLAGQFIELRTQAADIVRRALAPDLEVALRALEESQRARDDAERHTAAVGATAAAVRERLARASQFASDLAVPPAPRKERKPRRSSRESA